MTATFLASIQNLVETIPHIDIKTIVKDKILTLESPDDPFYLCDIGNIIEKYNCWKKNFPRVDAHYAVKSNPDPNFLKLLIALGAGFDCASKAEIQHVLQLGAKPERIVYAHPCKQDSHIRYARDNDVKRIVFDSEYELNKMRKEFPNAELILRIQIDDSSINDDISKYGTSVEVGRNLIRTASEIGLNIIGVCFHVGKSLKDINVFGNTLKHARALFDYAKEVGYKFSLMDIGGGCPGVDNFGDPVYFEKSSSTINLAIDKLFPLEEVGDVRFISEPGYFFSAASYTLVTSVVGKKAITARSLNKELAARTGDVSRSSVPAQSDEPAFMYYTNDSIHGSFYFFRDDELKPIFLKESPIGIKTFPSTIWGGTLNEDDRIIKHTILPEIDCGDRILWHNMGAYTVAMASKLNGFRTEKIFYVISEKDYANLQTILENKKVDIKFVPYVYHEKI